MGDPALDETQLHPPLTPELQARIPARLLRLSVPGETLKEALPRLKEVYTGSIAYEIEHISDHAERVWLRQAIETGRFRRPLAPAEQRALLERLAQVEGFETYLRRAFIGQKQFSIEGLDVLVPMLDETVELAARVGRARDPDRDRAPRQAQRPRTHRRSALLGAAARVRGRTLDRRARVRPGGRNGRREVPPRRVHDPQGERRRRAGDGRSEPEPSRGGRPGRRRPRARGADRPLERGRASTTRPSPCRSSSTATLRSRGRASSPRRSTSTRWTATPPVGRSTSSPTTRSASPLIPRRGARRGTRATSPRDSTFRSFT